MKSILMSIRPKWVAKILNGEKTLELRKSFPKDYRGWVYIYCTKEDSLCCIKRIDRDRYICGKDFDLRDFPHLSSGYDGKGKVVARFYCDNVTQYINGGQWHEDNTFGHYDDYIKDKVCELACVSEDSLFAYVNDLAFNAIHISKLEIFDYPKVLSEFSSFRKPYWNKKTRDFIKEEQKKFGCRIFRASRLTPLTRAPQSWMYVEEEPQ